MPPWLARLLGADKMGLQDSISAVLSRNDPSLNEIHPDLFGGRQHPVLMPRVTVGSGSGLPKEEYTELQRQLDSLGYLPQQRRPDWNEERANWVFNAVEPHSHDYGLEDPSKLRDMALDRLRHHNGAPRQLSDDPYSEDAWAMYLGLPQRFHSWEVSPYRPAEAKDQDLVYLRVPHLWENMRANDPNELRSLVDVIQRTKATGQRFIMSGEMGSVVGPAGTALTDFTMDVGEDNFGPYVSMFDIWDLDRIPGADRVGQPFEIYDRLYYDPKTFRVRAPR